MDIEFFFHFGYLGLFVVSFLAASIIPLSSEVFVLAMPPMGYNIWLVGVVATLGNFAGALTNYYVGYKGTDIALGRFFKVEPQKWTRAANFYQKWGPVALFFSWVPFIGDPLTAVAGAFKMNLATFTFWVLIGKGFRYVVLLGLADQIYSLLG